MYFHILICYQNQICTNTIGEMDYDVYKSMHQIFCYTTNISVDVKLYLRKRWKNNYA